MSWVALSPGWLLSLPWPLWDSVPCMLNWWNIGVKYDAVCPWHTAYFIKVLGNFCLGSTVLLMTIWSGNEEKNAEWSCKWCMDDFIL